MKVRVGNVVFEDFEANELDTVIEKLRKVGLLGQESMEEAPAPRQMPAQRPVPRPVPVPAPMPRPVQAPAPRPAPQAVLPQAPVPPQRTSEPEEEEESKSSGGWL